MNQKQRTYTIKRLEEIAAAKTAEIRGDPKCHTLDLTQKILADKIRTGKLRMRLVENGKSLWLRGTGEVSVDVVLTPDPREVVNKENNKRMALQAQRIDAVKYALCELKDKLTLADHPGVGLRVIETFEKRKF